MKNPGNQGKNPGDAETHAILNETLVQIRTRKFVAGIVLINDKVVETAPILRFLKGWSGQRVWEYCARYQWQVETVREARQIDMFEAGEDLRTDPDAAP